MKNIKIFLISLGVLISFSLSVAVALPDIDPTGLTAPKKQAAPAKKK
jgi:hypothetical protein